MTKYVLLNDPLDHFVKCLILTYCFCG